ncbi:MAG: tol-pal system protein YbgF [Lysobacterales bacterium]
MKSRFALCLPLVVVCLGLIWSAGAAAQSGRISLAERVARLEQQNQGQTGQSMVETLNRVEALQAEVRELRGLVEQQGFEIQELKKRARDQYVDLDSRLARLEGRPLGAATGVGAVSSDQAAAMPASGALTTEPPELQVLPADPLEAGATTGVDDAAGAELSQARQDALSQPTAVADTAPGGDGDAEQVVYDQAFAALREGRYAESARRFAAFLDQFPRGDLADNATYWLGESYYVTQNYQIALDTFKSLLERYPDSAKAPDAQLKLGYCYYELRQWTEAEAALNLVIARYPDTTVSRLAQGRLRALRLEGRTQ